MSYEPQESHNTSKLCISAPNKLLCELRHSFQHVAHRRILFYSTATKEHNCYITFESKVHVLFRSATRQLSMLY